MPSAKQTRFLPIIVFTAACLSLSAQCSTSLSAKDTVTVTDKDNGKKISLAKGNMLIVRLEARPGTGYGWQVAKNEADKLKPEGEPTLEPPDKEVMDGIEHQVFRFKAISEGTITLELHYVRPWEKEAPPEKTYSIEVQIR
ncbi:MAG TPA: protease inhibitor I42 family protein [Blastocatellia bacterium]|jgi:inhibitor of cysteine peptidase